MSGNFWFKALRIHNLAGELECLIRGALIADFFASCAGKVAGYAGIFAWPVVYKRPSPWICSFFASQVMIERTLGKQSTSSCKAGICTWQNTHFPLSSPVAKLTRSLGAQGFSERPQAYAASCQRSQRKWSRIATW
jgi:hypothetical protein